MAILVSPNTRDNHLPPITTPETGQKGCGGWARRRTEPSRTPSCVPPVFIYRPGMETTTFPRRSRYFSMNFVHIKFTNFLYNKIHRSARFAHSLARRRSTSSGAEVDGKWPSWLAQSRDNHLPMTWPAIYPQPMQWRQRQTEPGKTNTRSNHKGGSNNCARKLMETSELT